MTNRDPLIVFATLILIIIAIAPCGHSEIEKINAGDQKIAYDNVSTYSDIGMNSYYLDGSLVLSTFDNDKDGKADQWFIYSEGFVLESAMQDSDGDGKEDYFVEYDPAGNAVSEKVKEPMLKRITDAAWNFRFYILGLIIVMLIFLLIRQAKAKKKRHTGHDEHGHESHEGRHKGKHAK